MSLPEPEANVTKPGRIAFRLPDWRDAAVIAFGITLAALLMGGLLGYSNAQRLSENRRLVSHAYEVIGALESFLSTLKDAETGQRGFLLTSDEQYLAPYDDAMRNVRAKLEQIRTLTADSADQWERLANLQPKIEAKLAELQQTVDLAKSGDQATAITIVQSDAGHILMDEVRNGIAALRDAEQMRLLERRGEIEKNHRVALRSILLSTLLGMALVCVAYYLTHRNALLKQRTAERIAEQRERLRVTLASIGDAVITTDSQGNVLYLNAVAENLTGWTNADAMGKSLTTVFKIINEETRNPVANPVEKVLKSGTIVGLANHTLLIHKNGNERPIDDSAAPIRDEQGKIRGVVLVFRDFTERSLAEKAKIEQIRVTTLRAEIGTALASELNTQTGLQLCTEALVKHLQVAFAGIWILHEAEQMLEQQARASDKNQVDGPLPRVAVGEFKIGQIASTRRPHLTNRLPEDPNLSNPQWVLREEIVSFAGYPLIANGRLLGVMALFSRHELSEFLLGELAPLAETIANHLEHLKARTSLEQSENRFRSLVTATSQIVWTTEPNGEIQAESSTWSEYTGQTFEQYRGWGWLEMVAPEERTRTAATWREAVNNRAIYTTEYRLRRHDGVYRWTAARAVPVMNDDGTIREWVGTNTDIDDRKRSEAERRQSEARKAAILNTALDCIITCDHEGLILDFNPAAERTFGYRYEDVVGQEMSTIIVPPTLRRQHKLGMEHYMKTGVSHILGQRLQLNGLRADGTEFPIEFSVNEIPTEGKPLFTAYLRDITHRKQAEEQLRESERRWRMALDSADLGAWSIDAATQELMSDARFRVIFGVAGNSVSTEEAFAIVHDEDRQRIRDAVAAAMNPENPVPYAEQYRVVHPDGSIHWVDAKGRANFEPHALGPKLVSFDGTISDITERKLAAEREMQLLAETAVANAKFGAFFDQGAIFAGIMDVTGVMLEVNRLAWEGCGYSKEEIVGKPFWQGPWWTPSHKVQEQIRAATNLAAAGDTFRGEVSYFVHDGSERKADIIVLPIRDEQGNVMFLAPTGIDITERKRLENELRIIAANLSEADHRKNEFLAMLAHELRNPLAPIRNAVQILTLAGHENDAQGELTSMMSRQVDQLSRLIDDLLDVSRITRGKIELRLGEVEIASVVNHAFEASKSLYESKGHAMSVTLPEEPYYVDGDPARLAQVVGNLLNNACKFTPDGGRVELAVEPAGNQVLIRVRDSGVGIAPEQLPNIFEMFVQLDNSLERSQSGLGIGLTLVKRLVEMHGGTVEVKSAGIGAGSEFLVRLPMHRTPDEALQKNSPVTLPTKKRRILVVDDNRDSASSLATLLQLQGHAVVTAYDGLEAVATAQSYLPDLILLDIGLPKLNGYEAARQIRTAERSGAVCIVALTGWGQEEDRNRSAAAGFDAHLVKPVNLNELYKVLENCDASR